MLGKSNDCCLHFDIHLCKLSLSALLCLAFGVMCCGHEMLLLCLILDWCRIHMAVVFTAELTGRASIVCTEAVLCWLKVQSAGGAQS